MKAITQERLLTYWMDLFAGKDRLAELELLRTLIKECEEIDTLTVSKLRPMCEAREHGIKRVLACYFGFSNVFHIVEQNGDKYWTDGEDDYHSDNEFIGWLPLPIYKPELIE